MCRGGGNVDPPARTGVIMIATILATICVRQWPRDRRAALGDRIYPRTKPRLRAKEHGRDSAGGVSGVSGN